MATKSKGSSQYSVKCIFCGGIGVTKEHYWAKWISPYVDIDTPSLHHVSHYECTDPAESITKKKQEGALHGRERQFSQKLPKVCKSCNTGWMSRLQEDAKPKLLPFLKGEWPLLDTEDQRLIAAWIVMFTMVNEFAHEPTVGITSEQRLWFKNHGTPPSGWMIWVGHVKGPNLTGSYNHFGGKVIKETPKAPNQEARWQTTAAILGNLFFMNMSTSKPLGVTDTGLYQSFAQHHHLRCLWPTLTDIVDSPDIVIDGATAAAVSCALSFLPPHLIHAPWDHD